MYGIGKVKKVSWFHGQQLKLELGFYKPPKSTLKIFFCFSQLAFGLLSVDRKSWVEVLVRGTSYEIGDLIPGSDYGVSIQSVLRSDTSEAVHREFSTRKTHSYMQAHTGLNSVHYFRKHWPARLEKAVSDSSVRASCPHKLWPK